MKKLISIAAAAAMMLSVTSAVNAQNNPAVYIDGARIGFNDQEPVILGEGTTLVPARGVFEAMGARVEWNEEKRQVRIDSDDNINRIYLTIDNPTMRVLTFTSIFDADEEAVTLDVAPQIINDRTMIPLRAISEAIGADVKWDADAYSVMITSKDYEPYTPSSDLNEPAGDNIKTGMTIAASADSVSEGETVDILVSMSNLPANAYLTGMSSLVSYSAEDFEYEGCELYRDGKTISSIVKADNAEYSNGGVKVLMVTLDENLTTSGEVAKLTFRAKTSKGGDFALVSTYDTLRGYDNAFTFTNKDNVEDMFEVSGADLFLDTTPVTVSGK